MIIIIDGYNVLKKFHGLNVSDTQKSAFVNLLGRYIKKRNHKVLVFFDGGPHRYPAHEKQKGITVWHSGELQSADDLIISYVQEHRTKELLVVTLDREICKKVGESRAQTIDPDFFYQKVRDACESCKTEPSYADLNVRKLSDENDDEVDAIMAQAAGMKIPFKEEVSTARDKQQSPRVRCSKKEKGYIKILEKL